LAIRVTTRSALASDRDDGFVSALAASSELPGAVIRAALGSTAGVDGCAAQAKVVDSARPTGILSSRRPRPEEQ
jgi:hypothetical protein